MVRAKLAFCLGLLGGFALSMILNILSSVSHHSKLQSLHRTDTAAVKDVSHSAYSLSQRSDHSHDHAHVTLDSIHGDSVDGGNVREVKFQDQHAHHDDDSEAKAMAVRVRVLVWVMTAPDNLDTKAIHVRNTWGKRANTLLFMSSKWNSTFPTIGLNVSEGREHLTAKSMQAFSYVYQHHFDDADWFMKADDDTYVIMENLRYLLSSYNPQDPIYFGHAFKVIVKQGYASGGAGYVISKEALRRLVTKGVKNASLCRQDGGAEDAEIGKCFMKLGIRLEPSLDSLGRSRFHCFGPAIHVTGSYMNWYREYDAYGAKSGIGNISDYAISFHYIKPDKMYEMEYFIYHLRPYGIISRPQSLNSDHKNSNNST